MGIELFEEGVSHNNGITHSRGEFEGFNSQNTGLLSEDSEVKNVVEGAQGVGLTVDDEVDGRQGLVGLTVYDGDGSDIDDEFLNDGGGTNKKTGSSVDDSGQGTFPLDSDTSNLDVGETNGPVSILGEGMVGQVSGVVLLVDSSEDQLGAS